MVSFARYGLAQALHCILDEDGFDSIRFMQDERKNTNAVDCVATINNQSTLFVPYALYRSKPISIVMVLSTVNSSSVFVVHYRLVGYVR
mmetsp:Transcript_18577/g.39084  ORF Transcript_18577/g.39084 Transcript_18577/m.39084 type:complete len:89 (+) Transcript_18577:661-927(+)